MWPYVPQNDLVITAEILDEHDIKAVKNISKDGVDLYVKVKYSIGRKQVEFTAGQAAQKFATLTFGVKALVYGFICDADDIDHAEEQCQNAYPECNIFWVHKGNSIIDAENEWIGE